MKHLIKKKWFWPVAVVAVLIVIAVIGQATGIITPRENSPPVSQPENPAVRETPVAAPAAEPDAEPETEPSMTPVETNVASVDYTRCIEETVLDLTDKEFFDFVKDINIEVNQAAKKITFTAALDDATAPEAAADFADTLIRRFHLTVTTLVDDSLSSPSVDYYGGLYDMYSIEIGVAPINGVGDTGEWWVTQDIPAGSHLPIVLSE